MMAEAVSTKITTSKIRIDIPDPACARQEEANADEPEEESESEEHRAIVFCNDYVYEWVSSTCF